MRKLPTLFLAVSPLVLPANHSGDKVIVAKGPYVCGSTPEALDEILKWIVRHDKEETTRTILRTRSTVLVDGDRIKILELGFAKSKVRLISIDKECWTPSEAARNGTPIR